MKNLNSILESLQNDEKADFLASLFATLQKEVNDILKFGACNNEIAEKTANVYYTRKKNKFFAVHYKKDEMAALPAVIANDLCLTDSHTSKTDIDYKEILREAYLYGTGTCQSFAIVGAYVLAKKYEVNLSIETIFSYESHTYIRLHTQPEYIFDFWSPVACAYDDTINWNESVNYAYIRNSKVDYKTDIFLDSRQLIEMGSIIFTAENQNRRESNIKKVMNCADQELLSVPSSKRFEENHSNSIY
ncbi:hypothetical protein [Legionella israelensis]|uniref:Uncharacterized protein n=1 Tax=Legionella israelensis TaxID=454 RepID=A0A0W0WNY5_9GAMM|nr:hypothetical protein [Legionella israelensis]KTD34029.1 hypothetical protein Lisr_0207 [Legionella israelensis]QBS10637.1 hypothetical protein E4T55_12780 [Legionella israelensis]QDP72322.1 hypothetical protein FOG18_07015 [Legionella israelensis]SCX84853.1 hypothetical protein SAMN02746069_00430 [Legionella israelensis DSM 19235]STX57590.1 Uncharacterised protein [Legionella israelensis]